MMLHKEWSNTSVQEISQQWSVCEERPVRVWMIDKVYLLEVEDMTAWSNEQSLIDGNRKKACRKEKESI